MSLYFIRARLIPSILVGLPFWIVLYEVNQVPFIAEILNNMKGVKFAGNLTIGLVFQYAWAMLVREVSKRYEDRYFKQQKGFPTVYMLMKDNDSFSEEFKLKLREKAQKDFGLELPVGLPGEDRRILDVGMLVLEKVRDVKEVHRHNTWYGFYRNLFAGSSLGICLAIIVFLLGLAQETSAYLISGGFFFFVYVAMFAVKKHVIVSNGERFSRQMYYTYLKG